MISTPITHAAIQNATTGTQLLATNMTNLICMNITRNEGICAINQTAWNLTGNSTYLTSAPFYKIPVNQTFCRLIGWHDILGFQFNTPMKWFIIAGIAVGIILGILVAWIFRKNSKTNEKEVRKCKR